MDLFQEAMLATRMRRFSESLSSNAIMFVKTIYPDLKAAQIAVLYAMDKLGPQTLSDIAAKTGFTHSSISQQAKRLIDDGLLAQEATEDSRQKRVVLTDDGSDVVKKLSALWDDLDMAVKGAIAETGYDFMTALDALERAFERTTLAARVRDIQRGRTHRRDIRLVPYDAQYKDAFASLNIAWLEEFFEVEDIDRTALFDPDGFILNGGGEIWFALVDGQPLGTFALKNWGSGRWEFTKFAVDSAAQGLGIGTLLMQCGTDRFQARAGAVLFLETHTSLKAARAVYNRSGWVELDPPKPSPYARANCYMEWRHDQNAVD